MAGQTLALADKYLKDFYLPPIIEAIPQKVEGWDEFKKDSESWEGRQVVIPVHTNGNSGVGARRASGTMPAAGYQEAINQLVQVKMVYGRIQIDRVAMKATRGNRGAFAKILTTEVEGCAKDFYRDLDRQILTGEVNSQLGTVKTAGTVTTVTLNYAGASSGPVSGAPGTRYLRKGDLVNIGTAAEHAAGTADNVTVTGITNRFQFTCASVTVAEDDIVCKAGAASLVNSSYLVELEGIEAPMITTGTYQNINVANYLDYQANVLAHSTPGTNRTLTWDLCQQAFDEADDAEGGVDKIFANIHMRREIIDMFINDRRYLGPKLDGGYKGELTFNEVPFKFMKRFPYNRLLFCDRSTWKLYTMGDMEWSADDGSILHYISGSDAYEGLLCYYLNFGCKHPRANAYLKDISMTLRAS